MIVTSPETPTKLEDSSIPDISTEPAVHLVLPEAVTVPEVVKRPDVQDAECLAGSEWQSYCYSCRCSASGLAECRRIDECKEFQGWCCVCKMPYLPICNQETAVKFGMEFRALSTLIPHNHNDSVLRKDVKPSSVPATISVGIYT